MHFFGTPPAPQLQDFGDFDHRPRDTYRAFCHEPQPGQETVTAQAVDG